MTRKRSGARRPGNPARRAAEEEAARAGFLAVEADYTRTGSGWAATITPVGEPMWARVQGPDLAATRDQVLDQLELLSDDRLRPLATMHTLDGDPVALALAAAREGV